MAGLCVGELAVVPGGARRSLTRHRRTPAARRVAFAEDAPPPPAGHVRLLAGTAAVVAGMAGKDLAVR